MKKLTLFTVMISFLMLIGGRMNAQVAINSDGTPPDNSAMLDVKSLNKGFLPPRVELSATNVASPVTLPKAGLLVYNIVTAGTSPFNVTPGYYCWNGTKWIPVMMPKGTNPGELLYWNGNQYVVLPIGEPGQVLGVSETSLPSWITYSGNNLVPEVTISSSANPVCVGTLVTFTAIPVFGGGSPTFQWKVNGVNAGSNSTVFSYVPANDDNIVCIMTSNEPSFNGVTATSNSIEMIVNPILQVGVSIVASSTVVCSGDNVTYNASPTNGGSSPVFQWKVNGINMGTNSPIFNHVPVNNDVITCTLTSNSPCVINNPATSNVITMVVNAPLVVGVSISASQNPVCAQTTVTFTATPVNGGNEPSYVWRVNGQIVGSVGPTFSYVPANNDIVACQLTSSLICTTGNPVTSTITMAVNPLLPVSVTTVATANPVCLGTSVTYTATPVNGGANPAYQWQKNSTNINGATNITYSYLPANSDVITCVLTSNALCATGTPATSLPISMGVNSLLPVSVIVSASANPVCAGTSVVFTAAPTNGGTNPIYQWKLNGGNVGQNTPTYTLTPSNGDVISCVLNSNAVCPTNNPAPSNNVTMTVNNNLPVSLTVVASQNPVCAGTSVTFTASVVNGGSSPVYQWKVDGNNSGTGASTYTYVPSNSQVITCTVTSNAVCPTGNPATSLPITMTVNPLLVPGVSIVASANNVCSGTSVTFTATPTNGGTPFYQWKLNGSNFGSNSPNITFAPGNNNQVSCTMTTSLTCVTANTANSNIIPMVVNLLKPVSISIISSANPVCAGTTVTYTATPVNGGTAPVYQWMLNGSPVGSNSPVFSYAPVNNDAVKCILTSSETCPSGSPATSNTQIASVTALLPVSISIVASLQTVCSGSPVLFTATPVNGGSSPGYQWKVNSINVPGATNATFNHVPVNNDNVSCGLTSNVNCATGSPANSNILIIAVIQPQPVSVSITATATTVCAGTPVTFSAIPVHGGLSPSYQWRVNSTNVPGATNATYEFVPANNNAVSCLLTSTETCISGNPATSNTITMTVNPILPVSITIAPSANPVCTGTSVTFTASPINQGSTPQYQWKVNGSNVVTGSTTYTYVPANNNQVSCMLTSNALCTTNSPAISNTVTMAVNALLVAGSISGNQTICSGTTPAQLTGTSPSNGINPTYQWQKSTNNIDFTLITGATSINYQPEELSATTYYRQLQNATNTCGGPLTTNVVTITVTPLLPVSVSISANPVGVVFQGNSVTYTATQLNGGTSPTYQWKVNGISQGTNSNTFTYVPVNNDLVTCILTSSIACVSGNPATSNIITVIVSNDPPVSVTISAFPVMPVCLGTTVTYTAIPENGGDNPVYKWIVDGTIISGATSDTYSDNPLNNENITCVLTSSLPGVPGNPATSNTIHDTVNSFLPVSVAITSSANPVCAGSTVTFAALVTNGGTPTYQWKVNGVNVTSNGAEYSFIPVNNDSVTCVVHSSIICTTGNPATSNAIKMEVTPIHPVSISITAANTTICAGSSVTFTANAVNGGLPPGYFWKVNGTNVPGANNSTYSYVPANHDSITCVLTSNVSCASGSPALSNTIVMTVNPVNSVSVSISASATNVCEGTTVLMTATPTNGGSLPVYHWKVNGNPAGSTGSTYSFIPLNNNEVTCELTSNATCPSVNPAISNPVKITVNPLQPVSNSIVASANPVCTGTSVSYNAEAVNGGANPVYQWKINGTNSGLNSPTFSYIPGNSDTVSCLLTSNALCATGNNVTSNKIIMTVNQLLPISIIVAASENNVCAGTPVTFTATAYNIGNSPVYQWLVNGSNVGTNAATYTYNPLNGDSVTCRVTVAGICVTSNPATAVPIAMIVNPSQPVSISLSASADTVCAGTNVTFTAIPVNGGTSPSYQWKTNGNNSGTNSYQYSYQPSNGDAVTCVLTSNAVCASVNSVVSQAKIMTVNPKLTVGVSIVASANPVCAGTAVSYTATPVNGGTNPICQWKVNGQDTGTNNPVFSYIPSHNDVVHCVLTSSLDCSLNSTANSNYVTMVVNELLEVSVSIVASETNVCSGAMVTFTATPANGGSSPGYQWQVNNSNVGATNSTYTYAPANNDSVSCILTSNATCPTNNPAHSGYIRISVSPSPVAEVSIEASANTVCNGTSIICTATPNNGGTNPAYQWKVNGVPVGTNSSTFSFTPVYGNIVSCTMTSSFVCIAGNPATSDLLPITVNPVLPLSVTIAANPIGTVCQGINVAFTATPENGGSSVTYQWKVNSAIVTGATNAVYNYAPANNDSVSCRITSSATCISGSPATSNIKIMSVTPSQAVSVSVSANNYALMPGTSVTYTATPSNGGSSPIYQWKVNNIVVGTNSNTYSYSPSNNDNILCKVTSNLSGCLSNNPATSNVINMIVYSTGTPCSGIATVVYGGMTYNTVQIGSQCWLRENINIGTRISASINQSNNSIIEKYCYNNDPNYCNIYGGLYQWAEMVQYLNGVTNTTHWNPLPTGNVQGICPQGWHIPTNAEASALITIELGGSNVAGGKMKEVGLVHWGPYANVGATNSSGYTSLPGGTTYLGGFGNIRESSSHWTITKGTLALAAYFYGTMFAAPYTTGGENYKTTGDAVRCLKD